MALPPNPYFRLSLKPDYNNYSSSSMFVYVLTNVQYAGMCELMYDVSVCMFDVVEVSISISQRIDR